MTMICLKEGGTFFGTILDYNWKDKFLVVNIGKDIGEEEEVIVCWDNIERVIGNKGEREK